MANFTKEEVLALAAAYERAAALKSDEPPMASEFSGPHRDTIVATALRALAKSMDAESVAVVGKTIMDHLRDHGGSVDAAIYAPGASHDLEAWEALYSAPPASAPAEPVSDAWRDDPSQDERWNEGVNFAITQLCEGLGVDPKSICWDAATETVDGDVSAVLGNVLRAAYGEEWSGGDDVTARIRSALVSPPAPIAEAEPEINFQKRIDEVCHEEGLGGAACGWRPCTGCYETEDGYPVGSYPHSKIFRCDVGAGCGEDR